MSRRRGALLAGVLVLGAAWLWVHTSAWEPDYLKTPADAERSTFGWYPDPAGPAPECTPPPGDRDRIYVCAYVRNATGDR